MPGKMLKLNAIRSKNAKLKFRKFSTVQKREMMQQKISVLQYSRASMFHSRRHEWPLSLITQFIISKNAVITVLQLVINLGNKLSTKTAVWKNQTLPPNLSEYIKNSHVVPMLILQTCTNYLIGIGHSWSKYLWKSSTTQILKGVLKYKHSILVIHNMQHCAILPYINVLNNNNRV